MEQKQKTYEELSEKVNFQLLLVKKLFFLHTLSIIISILLLGYGAYGLVNGDNVIFWSSFLAGIVVHLLFWQIEIKHAKEYERRYDDLPAGKNTRLFFKALMQITKRDVEELQELEGDGVN